MNYTPKRRTLAFDARASVFGYALFEDELWLLDWGRCAMRSGRSDRSVAEAARARISSTIDLCMPAVVIVRSSRKPPTSTPVGPVANAIARETARRRIPLIAIAREDVQKTICPDIRATKHELHVFLANWFPELRPRIPPPRRAWQSERRAGPVFDAVATGFAYLLKKANRISSLQSDSADSLPPAPPQLA